jgi:hypothetical protein
MKTNALSFAALSFSGFMLLGCTPEDEPSPGIWQACTLTETALSMSEASAFGDSADDTLASIAGEHTSTAVYGEDPSNTAGLSLSLSSSASAASFVDQSLNSAYPSATGNGQSDCPDYLKVGVDIAISTDDGAFSEDISATLRVYEDGQIEIDGEMDLASLQGSYAPDTAAASSASLKLAVSWYADAVFSGSLQLGMEGESGDTAWASIDPILTWPLSAAE